MSTPIQLDSLSNHQVTEGEYIHAYGSGFENVTGVQVGAEWATELKVDGTTIASFKVPHGAAGASEWVVVHRSDGTSSPCVSDQQRVTYADPLAPPVSALRLDSITPDTITLGRADSYWILGAGLSTASWASVGHSGCEYETYDETRLILHVPEQVRVDEGATTVEIKVGSPSGPVQSLHAPCIKLKDAQSAGGPPAVLSLDPVSLPSSGGRLTIHGGGFQNVQWVHVGPAEVTIDSVHHDTIVVTVGSLEQYVGERLGVEVCNDFGQNWAIDSHDHLTVTP
jgi:hypothetical protein